MSYKCEVCGMSVGSMTCGECGKELVHDTITTDDGTTVHLKKKQLYSCFFYLLSVFRIKDTVY